MPGIHITAFAGIAPEVDSRLSDKTTAQIAHNCLLWDGTLRPMPQWNLFRVANIDSNYAYIYEDSKTNILYEAFEFTEAVYLNGPPFAHDVIVGIDITTLPAPGYNSNLRRTESPNVVQDSLPLGLPTPLFTPTVVNGILSYATMNAHSISYTPQYHSKKPINRLIGVTFCRQTLSGFEESPLAVIPGQNPKGIMFEGDIINVYIGLDPDAVAAYGITHVRLYRTISGLDSGEQVGNELDTDWHLIQTIQAVSEIYYNDGGASTTDPLDLFLASRFYPPYIEARYFGLCEAGWFYAVSAKGQIQLSERYLHHAWPTENKLTIPETVTGAVQHFDNLYIGTNTRPYVVATAPGEGQQGIQASATAFNERLPCLPNTMVVAPSGALYAAARGIVSLSREGARVLSAGIANAGDVLYTNKIDDDITDEVRIDLTTAAAYWEGSYWGFVGGHRDIPQNVYYTSHIYPIEVLEEMASSASMLRVGQVNVIIEDMSSQASFLSASLGTALETITMPVEEINSTAELVNVILVTGLSVIVIPMEAIVSNPSFQSAGLVLGLVRTYMAYESINSTPAFLSATLA